MYPSFKRSVSPSLPEEAAWDLSQAVSFVNDNQGVLLLLAGIVAFWGVIVQRATARRRATLEFIQKMESDNDFLQANKIFVRLARSDNIASYAKQENVNTEEAQAIRTVLNQFELASVGIQNGILDYDMFKMWCRGWVIETYNNVSAFIDELRRHTHNDNLFKEFQHMKDCLEKGRRMRRRGKIRRILEALRKT